MGLFTHSPPQPKKPLVPQSYNSASSVPIRPDRPVAKKEGFFGRKPVKQQNSAVRGVDVSLPFDGRASHSYTRGGSAVKNGREKGNAGVQGGTKPHHPKDNVVSREKALSKTDGSSSPLGNALTAQHENEVEATTPPSNARNPVLGDAPLPSSTAAANNGVGVGALATSKDSKKQAEKLNREAKKSHMWGGLLCNGKMRAKSEAKRREALALETQSKQLQLAERLEAEAKALRKQAVL
ncbi:hypothetical protein BDY24DRAFT_439717 [Mrakia frigida]|uniref:uncharacterized protein n=1 Tax=Mrakia frigida TaxID=29902 RepID=UPI003FCC062D